MGGEGLRPPLQPRGRCGRERLAAASRSNLGPDDDAALFSVNPQAIIATVQMLFGCGRVMDGRQFEIQAHSRICLICDVCPSLVSRCSPG